MRTHLNTLFLGTDGMYLRKEGEAIVVQKERKTALRVPIHMLQAIVCLGRIGVSPGAMGLCAERGVALSFHRPSGRLVARVAGFTRGNVLLRKAQFRASEDPARALELARSCVLGKIANVRTLLLRAVRDHGDPGGALANAAAKHARVLRRVRAARALPELRGLEGEAAATYFDVFGRLLRSGDPRIRFEGRSRRPPRDAVNALLSFAYAMLAADVRGACETVGLDSQVGFLHVDRPGRPALALDLMEELRPVVAERVVLSVLNRRQIGGRDFEWDAGGAVKLTEKGRKTFLVEYQKRKQEQIDHPFLQEKVTIGMIPFLQARLLAKALREELDGYVPFLWR